MQFDNQKTRNVADVAARIMAGESVKEEPQMLEEELVGNQHKIDANKNKKIDAHDFKLLRAQKDKEKANSQKFGKDVKEETELTESHFKVGDEVICKASGMEGEVIKLDKEEGGDDEKYYTVKREDGKVMKYAPNELKKAEEEDEEDEKEEMKEATKEQETKFHKKLDNLVHSTFGKRKEEMKESIVNEASYSAKAARAGKDIGKPGKMFSKIAQSAAKRYGSEEKGKAVAGAVLKKLRSEDVELSEEQIEDILDQIDEAMFPGTKEYEKKFGQSPQQKLKKKGDTVPTSQGEMKKTEKGVVHTRRFSEMVSAYQEQGLKFVASLVKEEPTQDEYDKEIKKAQNKSEGKEKAEVAKASVQAVKNEETHTKVQFIDMTDPDNIKKSEIDLEERSLTEPEMKKKEEYVKGMKKKMPGFKERYGERAKEVMYATATKMAKKD